MNRRAGSVARLATPVKAWGQRFALLLLISAAVGLMVLGKADVALVERARTTLADGVAPILEVASQPVVAFNGMVEHAHQLLALTAENKILREQNRRLEHWQMVARRLEAENKALRKVLNVTAEPAVAYATARVIGDQGGAFVRSVLVNAGQTDGVLRGQAALTSEGLAGRVAESGQRTARVLLITDMNSRIPVFVGESRERAVLAGDNTAQPHLVYLGRQAQLAPGERVVTSGHGGVFPPGLPIGTVASLADGTVRVQPFVDWSTMEYLRLANYELPGVLSDFHEGAEQARGAR
ncbi:MAG: rod shape-determining protein MreC [Pseudomonadota bacterium]